jgi:hypothetical protein
MDYSAAPIQPIAQGLVTFPAGPGAGTPVVFDGHGCLPTVTRDPASPSGEGAYILTLDPGVPGNAGAVDPGVAPLSEPEMRCLITPRGVGAPPVSGIAFQSVSYILSPAPGVGADQIEITMQNGAAAFTDPAGGFELIVWKGI